MTKSIEDAVAELAAANPGGSVTPEAVAKAAEPDNWRSVFKHVKPTLVGLHREGKLVLTRKGKPVEEPGALKGVYRVKLPG